MEEIIFESERIMVFKEGDKLILDASDGAYWFDTGLDKYELIKLADAILAAT